MRQQTNRSVGFLAGLAIHDTQSLRNQGSATFSRESVFSNQG